MTIKTTHYGAGRLNKKNLDVIVILILISGNIFLLDQI